MMMNAELDLMNADLMATPHWAVVNAVRYALDHPEEESNAIATCDWLVGRWGFLPRHVREIIREDVGDSWDLPSLGPEAVREEWGRVRELWATTEG
jgi:hypothetical protein